jgi:signal transduction histidine kinase/response regulator RpfG family c-di-GMP phosphodiesterase
MKFVRKTSDGSTTIKPMDTQKSPQLPPWKILIVDDEVDIHTMTQLGLKNFEFGNRPLKMLHAMSGVEAREILLVEPDIAVALIDVVMETDDAGLRLINFIRHELRYSLIRLMVRTGQPGMAPEREVIEHYDIDDYKCKTELTTDKLYLMMRMALKSYRELATLDVNRKALRKILENVPRFNYAQSLTQLFHYVLSQLIDLCHLGENRLIYGVSSGLILTLDAFDPEHEQLVVQSAIGRFASDELSEEVERILNICTDYLSAGKSPLPVLSVNALLIPIEINEQVFGFAYLENALYLNQADLDLIHIMVQQCSSALANFKLYTDLKAANQKALKMLELAEQAQEAEIARREAEIARREAEIANQAKSQFLANMSHELRTPLNGILGYAQILLRDKTISPEQLDGLKVINRSGEYLLTLINDVLDLAKIEASCIELYPTHFHLGEFLESIVQLFQMRALQKNIVFNYEPLSALPQGIYADEKRLRQILINLLGNAIKFTQKGRVTLKVGYDKENNVRFQVEDTGVGILPEQIDQIFEPFQQVGHQEYHAEGTGLGLSITKKLVEMMGGELHVRSELGTGSTFWVVLSLQETKNWIKSHQENPPNIVGYTCSREGVAISQGLKILVVDNRPEERSIIIKLLEPLGFVLYEASHGAEGLCQAIEIQPDLIFTDLVMPILDGFELTRQLRKILRFQPVPIIAISASVFDSHQQQSFTVGCNAFLSKPIHVDTLLDLMQQHLVGFNWIRKSIEIMSSFNGRNSHLDETETLSSEQARKLYDLSLIGDVAGILIEIEKLRGFPKLKTLTSHLEHLVDGFKLGQICELMRPYVHDADPLGE